MYDATSYVWALVLIVAIGIPLTTAIALYGGELTARMPRRADPALEGEIDEESYPAFQPTAPEIETRVRIMLHVIRPRPLGGEAHVRRQGQRPLHGR
jgi:hypothetical protein